MKQKILCCLLSLLVLLWTNVTFLQTKIFADDSQTSDPNTSSSDTNQQSPPQSQSSPQDSSSNNQSTAPSPTPDLPQDPNTTSVQDSSNPTPTPTPTVTPTPDPSTSVQASNSATTTDTISSNASSGNNSIIISPTPTPTTTPTPTSTPNGSEAISANPTPTPTPDPSTITTGDAASVTEAQTDVNSTSTNSDLIYQTINIYDSEDGNLDLSVPLQVAQKVITDDENDNPVINVSVNNANNYAYVTNDISSSANTGDNVANSNGVAVIDTGNAYSIASLLNSVNMVLVDSTVHVVTINIFGHLKGDIILPDSPASNQNSTSPATTTVSNNASVNNVVDSSANSGNNSETVTDTGNIATGSTTSIVDLSSFINSFVLNSSYYNLSINTFGSWLGNFLGWAGFDPSNQDTMQLISSTPIHNLVSGTTTSITNNAIVNNIIHSAAITGGNSETTNSGDITTGNAYSVVSLFNLVNSSFVNSVGFFGFINIFGELDGDIGGQSAFVTPTPTPSDETADQTSAKTTEDTPNQDTGVGVLQVTASDNVGAFVLPGDTVTFFITVKNTGNGYINGANLQINLIQNGVDMGGTAISLGSIRPGGGAKISTGLVLSKNALSGTYDGQVTVTGSTGPDGSLIKASADTSFVIGGNPILSPITQQTNNFPSNQTQTPVIVASSKKNKLSNPLNSGSHNSGNGLEEMITFATVSAMWGGLKLLQILRKFI